MSLAPPQPQGYGDRRARFFRLLFRLTPFQIGAALFALALALRIAGIIATHQYLNLERFELEKTAISLAATGVLGNPYAIPTGPSAHVSPAYPILLAVIFKFFGLGVPGEIVKEVFACCVTALQCAVTPLVAMRLGFSARAAVIAGLGAALLPLKFITETQGDWESNWAALALMLIAVSTTALWTRREFTLSQGVQTGIIWGCCLLVSWSYAALFGAVMAAGLLIAGRSNPTRYLTFSLVVVGCTALCLMPWVIRNWFALHGFVPGRSNTGIELRLSNNDRASAKERTNFLNGLYHRYHPLQSLKEAEKVLALGEVEYNRRLTLEAWNWVIAHPAQFARLTVNRFRLFWFYSDSDHPAKAVLMWTRTLLGLFGLVLIWRANLMSARVLTLILLVVPLPNYLVHIALKHSYPVDWILTILAGVAIADWTARFRLSRADVYPNGDPIPGEIERGSQMVAGN